VVMDVWMLLPGWNVPNGNNLANPRISLADVVNHIDHICQVAGDATHVAIGSDLDGGYGREASPYDLDTIADLQKLPGLLQARGFDADDIAGVMHGNWLRLLHQSWRG